MPQPRASRAVGDRKGKRGEACGRARSVCSVESVGRRRLAADDRPARMCGRRRKLRRDAWRRRRPADAAPAPLMRTASASGKPRKRSGASLSIMRQQRPRHHLGGCPSRCRWPGCSASTAPLLNAVRVLRGSRYCTRTRGVAELAPQRFRKAAQAELARAVDAVARQADPPERRADARICAVGWPRRCGSSACVSSIGASRLAVQHPRHVRRARCASRRPNAGTPAPWTTTLQPQRAAPAASRPTARGAGQVGGMPRRPAPAAAARASSARACADSRAGERPTSITRAAGRDQRVAAAWPMPPRGAGEQHPAWPSLHAAIPSRGAGVRPAAAAGFGTRRHTGGRSTRAACTMSAWSPGRRSGPSAAAKCAVCSWSSVPCERR